MSSFYTFRSLNTGEYITIQANTLSDALVFAQQEHANFEFVRKEGN